MEALPELGEGTSGDSSDRAPMLEEIMADDVRFGMKMRALRGDFAPYVLVPPHPFLTSLVLPLVLAFSHLMHPCMR